MDTEINPYNIQERETMVLRSEAAKEIIERKPGFLERWSLVFFLGIFLLLVSCSWFVQYPEVIEATAYLLSDNAPKEIIIRHEGRIIKLFAHNDASVREGDMIAWIESAASHQDVISLSQKIDTAMYLLNARQFEGAARLFDVHYSRMGELQNAYQEFLAALQLFNDYEVNGFYKKKSALLEKDVATIDEMNRLAFQQKKLYEEDIELSQESFLMNKQLRDENVLSAEEFRRERSKFVNKQMSVHSLNSTILSNQSQQREKQKDIDQLTHDILQQKNAFEQALVTFRNAIDEWERIYIIHSPINGRIALIMPLQENQFVVQGRLIGYFVPTETTLFAQVSIPQGNSGKIDTGLQVQLRFEAYPYQEFGVVEGKLNYISNIATDSGFIGTIQLNRGLLTNNNKRFEYRSGLKAKAIIITKRMRMLQRLYYNVIKTTSLYIKN